jgi:hypothetical protein
VGFQATAAIDVSLDKKQENSLSLWIKYEVSIMDKLRRLVANQLHFIFPLSRPIIARKKQTIFSTHGVT